MCNTVCSFCWIKTELLISIFSTKTDKVNCSFAFKMELDIMETDIFSCTINWLIARPYWLKTINKSTNTTQTTDSSQWSVNGMETQEHCHGLFDKISTSVDLKYWLRWTSAITWEPTLLEHMCPVSPCFYRVSARQCLVNWQASWQWDWIIIMIIMKQRCFLKEICSHTVRQDNNKDPEW